MAESISKIYEIAVYEEKRELYLFETPNHFVSKGNGDNQCDNPNNFKKIQLDDDCDEYGKLVLFNNTILIRSADGKKLIKFQ